MRCPFPKRPDADRINEATVILEITVEADGRVSHAKLLDDPGYGFGAAALACVRGATFPPALDAAGRPMRKTNKLNYRFSRNPAGRR